MLGQDFKEWELPKLLKSEDRLREAVDKLLDPEFNLFLSEREEIAEALCYLADERQIKETAFEEVYATCIEYGFAVKDNCSKREATKILPHWLMDQVYNNEDLIEEYTSLKEEEQQQKN